MQHMTLIGLDSLVLCEHVASEMHSLLLYPRLGSLR